MKSLTKKQATEHKQVVYDVAMRSQVIAEGKAKQDRRLAKIREREQHLADEAEKAMTPEQKKARKENRERFPEHAAILDVFKETFPNAKIVSLSPAPRDPTTPESS